MDKKDIYTKISVSLILSVLLKLSMKLLDIIISSEIILKVINFIFCLIIIIPVLPLIKYLYNSKECKNRIFLKLLTGMWLAFVITGNILMIVTEITC